MGKVVLDEYLVVKRKSRVYIDHHNIGARHEECRGKWGMGTNIDKVREKDWENHRTRQYGL